MAEMRKLTAEEFEEVKNSGKYTQEQLEKIKDMEIPVNINELSDEQIENVAGGLSVFDQNSLYHAYIAQYLSGIGIAVGGGVIVGGVVGMAGGHLGGQFGLNQDGGQNHG